MKSTKYFHPLVIALSLTLCVTNSFSQKVWQRNAENPFFTKEANQNFIGSPCVINVNGTLKMYYATSYPDPNYPPGNPENRGSIGKIQYAYSTNGGVTWTKHPTPVLDIAPEGEWDSYFLDTPQVLWDGTTYRMWYFGDNDNLSTGGSFGLATSTDGINWTKNASNPVLTPGTGSAWDNLFIESPAVIYDNGTYYMAFTGIDIASYNNRIGVATSTNGINWTKYSGNPVVSQGNSPSFDDFGVATPSVLKNGNVFQMWYNGASIDDIVTNPPFDKPGIGYATSSNFFTWTKYSGNPVLTSIPTEPAGPWANNTISTGSTYTMYYEYGNGFGRATSTNPASSVSITSPANGATFTAPANITINASASDPDGISKVEFFYQGGKLGEDLTAPYSYTANNIQAGNYALTAKATDNLGVTTTSGVVNASVSAATTTLTDPLNDWSKSLSHTSNATFDVSNPAFFEGDNSRMSRTNTSAGSVTYSWSNLNSFSARVYYFTSITGKLKVYVSSNNTTWTSQAFQMSTPVATGSGWYGTTITPAGTIPAGKNYLKIELLGSTSWAPQLSSVTITRPAIGGRMASSNSPENVQTNEIELISKLIVYPNPVKDKGNISFTLLNEGAYNLELFDLKGALIKQITYGETPGNLKISYIWDTSDLPNGVYITKLRSNGRVETKRVIILH